MHVAYKLINAALERDVSTIQEIFSNLPVDPTDPLSGFEFLTSGIDEETRLLGVQCLAGKVRTLGFVVLAGDLAGALWSVLKDQRLIPVGAPAHMIEMGVNIAELAAACFNDSGRGREVLLRAPEWLSWMSEVGLSHRTATIALAIVEAAILTGEYERAANSLSTLAEREPDIGRHPVYLRLNDKLDDMIRAVDQVDRPGTPFQELLRRTLELLAGAHFQVPEDALPPESMPADLPRDFEDFVKSLGFPGKLHGLKQTAEAVANLPQSQHPLFELNGIVESCHNFLREAGSREGSPDDYRSLAVVAKGAQREADRLELWEESLSLGWLESVALRRAKDFASAAVTLRELRDRIRRRQLGISNPRLRAALAVHLPHLAAVSAEVLFNLGKSYTEELFEAIESSKSRILRDLILLRREVLKQRAEFTDLRALLTRSDTRVSYCTFLTDDDNTYAVLMACSGELYSVRFPLGRGDLAAATEELSHLNDGNPNSWEELGKINPEDPWKRSYENILTILKPFGSWLDQLLEDGNIRDKDVLCIAPDGPLYSLPIQSIDVGGIPLGVRFGCSIVPSADVLLACAGMRGAQQLRRALAIIIPMPSDDLDLANQNLSILERYWHVEFLGGPDADVQRVRLADLRSALLHFAAHGTFDLADPLVKSGILLAANHSLPSGRGDPPDARLSPNKLAEMDLAGSHISFRTCVSGRTTEITSREALGLIWAAFQAGASSALAGQWHVYTPTAAELLDDFYRGLGEGMTLIESYRAALEAMHAQRGARAHPYHYASLAFFGYWR